MRTKILMLVLLSALSINLLSQLPPVTLTFGTGKSSAVQRLDSIRVSNLTRQCDTLLQYPDTMLVLDIAFPCHKKDSGNSCFTIVQTCPGTIPGQYTIMIFIPSRDRMDINVTDERRKSVVKNSFYPQKGYHLFLFRPGKKGNYTFHAKWKGISCLVKISSIQDSRKNPELIYHGYEGGQTSESSSGGGKGFGFTPGDNLVFKAYARLKKGNTGTAVISDKPLYSQVYRFEIR